MPSAVLQLVHGMVPRSGMSSHVCLAWLLWRLMMSDWFYRLGRFGVRRRVWVLAVWAVVLVGTVVLAGRFGGEMTSGFEVSGTEAQEAADLLAERFPETGGSSARVVFSADDRSLTEPQLQDAVGAALAEIADQPGVVFVTDPFQEGTISPDGRVGFATVGYSESAEQVAEGTVDRLFEAAAPAAAGGLQVEFGGRVVEDAGEPSAGSAELIGLGVAVLVLLWAFGSVLAMGLPIATAVLGLWMGLSAISLLGAVVDLSDGALMLAAMIALAVGIDYALIIVTRYRQNLASGMSVEEAVARANATAGVSVVFAGSTTVIALSSLAVVGIPVLTNIGLAVAMAVAIAVTLAVSLLPALLGFVGTRIDKLALPGLRVRDGANSERMSLSERWARMVTQRPWVSLGAAIALMALLAVPFFSMRLGLPDAGVEPESTTERRAYDLLAEGFGPGFNGPIAVVIDLDDVPNSLAVGAEITAAVNGDHGIVSVSPPIFNDSADTALVMATPTTGPADATTETTIERLRRDVIPGLEDRTGAAIALTGPTAADIDLTSKLGAVTVPFMAVVIGLTMLLLMVAFRSILVPIKAALGILISIVAAFGVVVAVFQWGWLSGLVGLEETVPIVPIVPVMMFAILFGLSMDYEVFIVSRIREDFHRTGDTRRSVVSGLAATARVITAAALVMISVFVSFALTDDTMVKMFGVGLAAAVLLDATVVRMVIVPATMTLFDKANWWLPRWLDRLLPHLDVEGDRLSQGDPPQ